MAVDIDFRPISIEDRDELESRLRHAGYPLCEYTFATLFCWQGCNRTRWAVHQDWLLLRFEAGGHERFLCPVGTGDPRPAIDLCMDHLARRGHPPVVEMVPGRVRDRLPAGAYWVEPDKPNFDYIYLREDLATLAGRRYSRKRNHIKHFSESCSWTFLPLVPQDVHDCLCFLEEWRAGLVDSGNPWLDFEVNALRVCLAHLMPLAVMGRVLRVDGRVAALSIGEALTEDTFVVHYEKAVRDCEGVYPMVSREFARAVPDRFTWINREQDMGVPGLRVAKESWFPVRQEPAFTLTPEPPKKPGP